MLFALKVDVDTFRGMREGLPRLLGLFAERRIRATIFVSMGPDHSGRAIRRIVTKPGFLGKMLRTNAVSLYGPRTLLYGTLLPGPRIASRNAELFRRIEAEGHEAGVHGWDHVRWQDGLPKFDEATIARELDRAFEVFSEITGHAPRATAAPGWIANERSLAVQDRLELAYCSDVRGHFPFQPRMGGRLFRTPQLPTTLPTLDEMIGREELFASQGAPQEAGSPPKRFGAGHAEPGDISEAGRDATRGAAFPRGAGGASAAPGGMAIAPAERWIAPWLVAEAKRQALARPGAPVVHTIHTEVEGLSRAPLFADLLDRLLAEGARFTRLDEAAAGLHSPPAAGGTETGLPACDVVDGTLPGRSGLLALQCA